MDSTTKLFAKSTLPLVLVADIGNIVFKRDLRKAKRLLKMSALLFFMRQSELKGELLKTTFLSQVFLKCFSWQFSLYVMIRQILYRFRAETAFLVNAKAIFAIHFYSWYLLGVRADKVEPGYLRMWSQTLPEYNKGLHKSWLADFSSEATSSEFYPAHLTKPERLKQLPKNFLRSVRFQFPFCMALYVFSFARKLPSAISPKQVLLSSGDLLFRSLRTSAALSTLPYSMCAFPCIYAALLRLAGPAQEVRRNTPLHLAFAAGVSTWAFLQEPVGRRKMMVGYMIWRVCEALMRSHVVKEEEKTKKSLLAAAFTALTVRWCLPVGLSSS